MENQDQEKEAIIRAKQAVSPAGLGDRSDKATRLPGNDSPEDTPLSGMNPEDGADRLEDEYMDGDEPGANVRQNNPNRNPNPKPDIDKPAYS
jgi:hypothetical protein